MRTLPRLCDGNDRESGRFAAGRASLRGKGVAVLASLLLHLVALAGIVAAMRGPDAVPAGVRPSLVTIAIRQDSPPPARSARETRSPPASHRVPQAQLPVQGKVSPPPAPMQAGAVAVAPAKAAPDSAPLSQPLAPAPDAHRATATAGLDAYRTLLWHRILAARPRGAQGEGRVVVRFRIDRQGRLLLAEIAQSSGQVLLDKLALRAVRAAAPFAPPPQELEESGLTYAVPIDFHG